MAQDSATNDSRSQTAAERLKAIRARVAELHLQFSPKFHEQRHAVWQLAPRRGGDVEAGDLQFKGRQGARTCASRLRHNAML